MKRIDYAPKSASEPKAKVRVTTVAQKCCAFRLNWLPLEHDSIYDPSYADLKPSEAGYIKNSTETKS